MHVSTKIEKGNTTLPPSERTKKAVLSIIHICARKNNDP